MRSECSWLSEEFLDKDSDSWNYCFSDTIALWCPTLLSKGLLKLWLAFGLLLFAQY
jgi:hypothetical protein